MLKVLKSVPFCAVYCFLGNGVINLGWTAFNHLSFCHVSSKMICTCEFTENICFK